MNETELQFLNIRNLLKRMEFDVQTLPGRLAGDLKEIRKSLDWIERNHLPSGLSRTVLERIKEKTIFVNSEKGKNAIAFQIHNVIQRPRIYELVGIKIVFGTSENGIPGLTFEGTRENPTTLRVTDLPWISEDNIKTPKKFEKWIREHIIDPKKLSEKVENFALIDLCLTEMSELGLGEADHQGMPKEKIEEEKNKKTPKQTPTATTPPTPPPPTAPQQQTPVTIGGDVKSHIMRRSPMYLNGIGFGLDSLEEYSEDVSHFFG
jgi:hypothetical protein